MPAFQGVTEDMLDTLVLAGVADDIHRRFERFVGLCDSLVWNFPVFGAEAGETKAGQGAVIEAFDR